MIETRATVILWGGLIMNNDSVHTKIRNLLDLHDIKYQTLHHESVGKSDEVAKARGTRLEQGAKALLCFNGEKYLLAILPANKKLDFKALAAATGGKRVSLADRGKTEEITGCVIGSIPPFTFNPCIELVVDPSILELDEIAFNAGRLDCSIVMKRIDYEKIIRKSGTRLLPITKESHDERGENGTPA